MFLVNILFALFFLWLEYNSHKPYKVKSKTIEIIKDEEPLGWWE